MENIGRRLIEIPEGVIRKYLVPAKVIMVSAGIFSRVLLEEVWLFSSILKKIGLAKKESLDDIIYLGWEFAPKVVKKDFLELDVKEEVLKEIDTSNIYDSIFKSINSISENRLWRLTYPKM